MSIKVMSHVWDTSKSEGSTLLLLLSIADHCHDDGTGAWPSIKRLASRTRQTVRHTQRLLQKLQSIGELEVKYSSGPNGVNTYTIPMKGGDKMSPGDTVVTGGVTTSAKKVPQMSPDPSEPSLNRRRESADRPSISEVLATAEMIGLAEWKARDWFDEMEGCGWLDFQHRPVVRWQSILNRVKVKWEADGRPVGPPAGKPSYVGAEETKKQQEAAKWAKNFIR